jgi:hypothetical protein
MFLCSLPGHIEAGAVRGRPELTVNDLDRDFRELVREYHARPHGEAKLMFVRRSDGVVDSG